METLNSHAQAFAREHHLELSAVYVSLENLDKRNKIQEQVFRTLSLNTVSHIVKYASQIRCIHSKATPFCTLSVLTAKNQSHCVI